MGVQERSGSTPPCMFDPSWECKDCFWASINEADLEGWIRPRKKRDPFNNRSRIIRKVFEDEGFDLDQTTLWRLLANPDGFSKSSSFGDMKVSFPKSMQVVAEEITKRRRAWIEENDVNVGDIKCPIFRDWLRGQSEG